MHWRPRGDGRGLRPGSINGPFLGCSGSCIDLHLAIKKKKTKHTTMLLLSGSLVAAQSSS